MKYNVEYSKTAMNTIKKMDSSTSKLIRTWIEKNLIDAENPRVKGKALTGDFLLTARAKTRRRWLRRRPVFLGLLCFLGSGIKCSLLVY